MNALLNMYDLVRGTRVQSPDVRNERSVRIHVGNYSKRV
jgi:hypothetical protein